MKKSGKIIGIDYGSKRVGVSVSDENRNFAMPLCVIENTQLLVREIEKIALDAGTKEIVLGESRNYKGEMNDIMIDAIDFKKELEEKGLIVYFEPEFMTSVQAERITGKNSMSDASAAALILQSYLDRIKNSK